MAKRTNSFAVKGQLDLAQGIVYEEKKEGKEIIIVEIPFFDFLREFDLKTVSISIKEEVQVEAVEDEELEDEE